nr:hypothetical protein Itr_chr10CG08930 [Ipomoea trifida]
MEFRIWLTRPGKSPPPLLVVVAFWADATQIRFPIACSENGGAALFRRFTKCGAPHGHGRISKPQILSREKRTPHEARQHNFLGRRTGRPRPASQKTAQPRPIHNPMRNTQPNRNPTAKKHINLNTSHARPRQRSTKTRPAGQKLRYELKIRPAKKLTEITVDLRDDTISAAVVAVDGEIIVVDNAGEGIETRESFGQGTLQEQ